MAADFLITVFPRIDLCIFPVGGRGDTWFFPFFYEIAINNKNAPISVAYYATETGASIAFLSTSCS